LFGLHWGDHSEGRISQKGRYKINEHKKQTTAHLAKDKRKKPKQCSAKKQNRRYNSMVFVHGSSNAGFAHSGGGGWKTQEGGMRDKWWRANHQSVIPTRYIGKRQGKVLKTGRSVKKQTFRLKKKGSKRKDRKVTIASQVMESAKNLLTEAIDLVGLEQEKIKRGK